MEYLSQNATNAKQILRNTNFFYKFALNYVLGSDVVQRH